MSWWKLAENWKGKVIEIWQGWQKHKSNKIDNVIKIKEKLISLQVEKN